MMLSPVITLYLVAERQNSAPGPCGSVLKLGKLHSRGRLLWRLVRHSLDWLCLLQEPLQPYPLVLGVLPEALRPIATPNPDATVIERQHDNHFRHLDLLLSRGLDGSRFGKSDVEVRFLVSGVQKGVVPLRHLAFVRDMRVMAAGQQRQA